MMPNYTPSQWWECDIFAVTKAGYFVEYEIKRTVADFRADAKKGCGFRSRSKHAHLEAHEKNGPSRFWYVTPKGLVAPSHVPLWAGVLYISPTRWGHAVEVARNAPRLHWHKCNPAIIEHAYQRAHWRFWDLWKRAGFPAQPTAATRENG